MVLDCPDLAVPKEVMQHIVRVESSRNPFAIGVVGGALARQPRSLEDALAAVQALKAEGYNFSVGIAQVNRYNLAKYGLKTYAQAFEVCPNLQAGSRILRECYDRAKDWGKAFSCYYSGNFVTGFEHGYVQKIFASMRKAQDKAARADEIRVIPYNSSRPRKLTRDDGVPLRAGEGSSRGAIRQSSAEPDVGNGLADIPLQVVGGDGDPYRTRVVPGSSLRSKSVVAPSGAQLPLPDLNAALPAQPVVSRRMVPGKSDDGALLHVSESPAVPKGGEVNSSSGAREPTSSAGSVSFDESFVF